MQRVFAEVLGRAVEEMSMLADFFAAGGTSLQAMRIASLLQDALGVHVGANEIIAAAVVRAVADLAKEKLGDGAAAADDLLVRNEWSDDRRPASSGQESLYLAYLMDPEGLEVGL